MFPVSNHGLCLTNNFHVKPQCHGDTLTQSTRNSYTWSSLSEQVSSLYPALAHTTVQTATPITHTCMQQDQAILFPQEDPLQQENQEPRINTSKM